MKNRMLCIAALLLSLLLFPACSNDKSAEDPVSVPARAVENSNIWTLGDRYPWTYSSLCFIVTYEANGEPFCLKINRNKKETGMSKRVREFREVDGIIFALCDSKLKKADGEAAYTYYECYTGEFRYFIGREDSDRFYIETILSMDDAIALINRPTVPKDGVRFLEEEWNAQFKTEDCNLEILIRPDDGGKLVKSLPASYTALTEDNDVYYVSSTRDDIVYSNGTHSVQIRQATRSDSSASYHTLSECKAIIALFG